MNDFDNDNWDVEVGDADLDKLEIGEDDDFVEDDIEPDGDDDDDDDETDDDDDWDSGDE